MKVFCDKNDFLNYRKMSAKSHCLILEISKNILAKKILTDLEDLAYMIQIKSLQVPGRLENSLKEHKGILQAIKEGNPELANKLTRIHFENTLKNIIKNVKNII